LGSRFRRAAAVLIVVAALWPRPRGATSAAAAGEVLRDTEIENDIRTMATPIWRVAGLDPRRSASTSSTTTSSTRLSPAARRCSSTAGLIERAETPNMLIGVIAHETGHIAGGHILRSLEAIKNASVETIIAMVGGARRLGRRRQRRADDRRGRRRVSAPS
jgi:Zn-dependent protease with chaperone function